jgi:hypothetical protein
MRRQSLLSGMIASLLLVASVASAQGKGYGNQKPDKSQSRGQGKQEKGAKFAKADKPDKAFEAVRGKPDKTAKSVNKVDKPNARVITESGGDVERSGFRSFVVSNKHGEKLAGRAIASAMKHGAPDDAFVISPVGRNVYILNPSGMLLANFDSDEDLGTWKAVTLSDRDKKGAPSFCRSGAGHPVWGRQWCVDKGFGLGSDGDLRWSRVIEHDNVLFMRPVTTGELTRVALVDLLGDVVVNRLATQAITLGLIEPLTGRWIGEPASSRVLLLSSGARPVAEVVDLNRDNRADMLLVAVKP